MTDTSGHASYTGYDAAGQVVSTVVNYTGGVYNAAYPDRDVVTWYGYDAAGQRIWMTDTLGYVTRTGYDAVGRVVSTTSNYSPTVYPGHGARNEWNLVTRYVYDGVGNQTWMTDTVGRVTRTEYDGLGRPLTVTANYTSTDEQNYLGQYNLVTRYAYDGVGNQTWMTDTVGRVTRSEYDGLGRPLTVTANYTSTDEQNYLGQYNLVTRYAYDGVGNRVAVTDTMDYGTTYGYDVLGRTTAITDALDYAVTTEYDGLGRRVRRADDEGRETTYAYDALGHVVQVGSQVYTATTGYDALGRTAWTARGGVYTTTFGYDALGRQTVITDTLGHTTTTGYDGLGRQISSRDAISTVTRYGYDALGRLVSVVENWSDGGPVDQESNVTTHYAYDLAGNRRTTVDAMDHTTVYTYDVLDRLVATSDPLEYTFVYTYDVNGNRTAMTDAEDQTTTYVYDALDRQVQIVYPETAVTRAYDALGRQVAMTDATGTTTWAYDALGRVLTVTAPSGDAVGYGYDGAGNRTNLIYPDPAAGAGEVGGVVTYTHNAANWLVTVTDLHGEVTSYAYDSGGMLTGVARPNDVDSAYTYDGAGRLTTIRHVEGIELLAAYTYTLDAVGNRKAVTETLRRPAEEVAALMNTIIYAEDAPGAVVDATRPPGVASLLGPPVAGEGTAPLQVELSLAGGLRPVDTGDLASYADAFSPAAIGRALDATPDVYTVVPASITTAKVEVLTSTVPMTGTKPPSPPAASFVAGPLSGASPLSVRFFGTFTGAVTSWEWHFGDGTTLLAPGDTTGREQHPVHTYRTPGTYDVTLVVVGPGGTSEAKRAGYIAVGETLPPAPKAGFDATPLRGEAPLTVQFANATAGRVTGYVWDFGDGNESTKENPSHVYEVAGTYTVSLSATGPGGIDVCTRTSYIVVTEPVTEVPLPTLPPGPQWVTPTLPQGVSQDWWRHVQEGIRESEYLVTWQDATYLDGLVAAYHAPNRAQDLRTYFVPEGIRVIRRSDVNVPPAWELGLRLVGYGDGGHVQPVPTAVLTPTGNTIAYQYSHEGILLAEWYINDGSGLWHHFAIQSPPSSAGGTSKGQETQIALDLALSGNPAVSLAVDGRSVALLLPGARYLLRYGDLRAYDAAGKALPARVVALSQGEQVSPKSEPVGEGVGTTTLTASMDSVEPPGGSAVSADVIRLIVDATGAVYPISICSLLDAPDRLTDDGQQAARFGLSVEMAGDVNGDGYDDVIVGAYSYDRGQAEEGRAYVYAGRAEGLDVVANWAVEGDRAYAYLGYAVDAAGDVNNDGYGDVVVGVMEANGRTDEARTLLFYGLGSEGLSTVPYQAPSGGRETLRLGSYSATGLSGQLVLQPGPTEGMDTMIDQSYPDNSYGDNGQCRIGTRSPPSYLGGPYRSLLRFDLSSLPVGAVITNASLQVVAYNYDYQYNTFQFYRVTSSWVETTTWNTQPTYDATKIWASFLSSTPYRTYVTKTVDVSDIISAWHTGVYTNYGFYIKGSTESAWTRHWILPSDYESESQRPKLVIDYYNPPSAGFWATPLSGTVPLTVTFTNSSTAATDYEWDFGDGVTSTLEHPTHGYAAAGVYTVTLAATGPAGTAVLTRTSYITVRAPLQLILQPGPTEGMDTMIDQSYPDNSYGDNGQCRIGTRSPPSYNVIKLRRPVAFVRVVVQNHASPTQLQGIGAQHESCHCSSLPRSYCQSQSPALLGRVQGASSTNREGLHS